MRLSSLERSIIKNAILKLDPQAQVFLFGSRVDDRKKGGDIDILIFSSILNISDKAKILNDIFKNLEEQKIDIVIVKDSSDPFIQIIKKEAVEL